MASAYTTKAITSYDGITPDVLPSYYRLDGTNGIRATLDNRQGSNIDYLLMMWVRSSKNQSQIGLQNETVIELEQSLTCGFALTKQFQCNSSATATTISLDITTMDTQVWIHVAISGGIAAGQSYIRIDYPDQLYKIRNASYISVIQNTSPWYAFLGINANIKNGFQGDIREFFFAQSYVTSDLIFNIKNQLMSWDSNQLGYYRLNDGNLNDAFRNNQAVLVYKNSTKTAIVMRDNMPNDICYPFVNTVQLPLLNTGVNDGSAPQYTLDQRYSRDFTTFKYTFSIWMKAQNGIQTTPNPAIGKDSLYFFKLDEAFTLYFKDSQNIVIYFHALKNYYETWSNPIYFPQNQWANLQIWIDRVNGYEARVYDLQRRLLVTVKQTLFLQEQRPSGKFYLGNNFKGYMKSVMLWQNRQNLPVSTSSGMSVIKDDNLLLYYKFDNPAFITTNSLYSLAQHSSYGIGQTITLGNSLAFNYVEWEDAFSFDTPSNLGTIYQTQNLFDGVACNDKNMTLRTSTTQSYMRYQMKNFTSNITSATVEFWFRRQTPINSTNYLFSLYFPNKSQEYLSIYQDKDQLITCSPFGSQNKAISVKFLDVNYTNTIWQHIACKFTKSVEVAGMYDSAKGTNYFYSQGITASTDILPQGQYYIVIGNSFNKTMGSSSTFFKEVRFWTTSRSNLQITQFLYQQLDILNEPSLFSYFRLGSGNDIINNFPGLDSPVQVERYGLVPEQENGTVICPLYTFYNQYTKNCYLNPFNKQNVVILAELVGSNLQWRLSIDYSDIVNINAFSNLTYLWTTSHQPLQDALTQQQRTSSNYLSLQTIDISPDYIFPITVNVKNDKRTFSSDSLINLAVAPCRYIADKGTQEIVKEITLTESQGTSDIVVEFGEIAVSGQDCTLVTQYLYLRPNVSWTITPSFLKVTNITTEYDPTAKSFKLTIPASEQFKFPSEQFVNLVGYVYWDDNATVPTSSIYLNIVYKIKFIYNIKAVITAQSTNLFNGQILKLDAGNSYVGGILDESQGRAGLSYQWSCDSTFQSLCSPQVNSKQLQITYDNFKAAGGLYQSYTFTLNVWRSASDNLSSLSSTQIIVSWININIPVFTITPINGKIYATKDNLIDIDLKNYQVGSTDLITQWTFSPSSSINSQSISLTSSNSVLQALTGSFAQNTSYMLTVSISNKNYIQTMQNQTLNFTTGISPSGGKVITNPNNGTFLVTVFNISISNWTSKNLPIQYNVFGYSSSLGSLIDLSKKYYFQNQSFVSTLPQLDGIQVQITDSSGEVAIVSQDLNVSLSSDANFTSIISALQNQTTDAAKKIETYQYIIYTLNGIDNQTNNPSQSFENRQLILNNLQTTVANLSKNDNSNASAQLIKQSMSLLPLISSQPSYMNDTIAQQVIVIVQQMQTPTILFQAQLNDSSFRDNYATTLSNLFNYANQKISYQLANSRRRSLSTVTVNSNSLDDLRDLIRSLIESKNNLTDQICQQLTSNEVQVRIQTDSFNIIIEQVLMNTTTSQRSYYDSQSDTTVIIPLTEIVTRSNSMFDGTISSQCLQTTVYKFNTLGGYKFQNQTQSSSILVEFSALANTGYRMIESSDFKQLSSQFEITFAYDFTKYKSSFQSNQTVCMVMNSELQSYSNVKWETENCITKYYQDQNKIGCQCSSISPSFYGIITDTTRLQATNRTVLTPNEEFKLTLTFDNSALSVIVILLAMMLGLPVIAVMLDKKDYQLIKSDTYQTVSDNLLIGIAIAKNQPLEQVIYQKKLINEYIQIQKPTFAALFSLFLRHLHPLISIFTGFNVNVKRLVRQMIVVYQASIIAIVIVIIFSAYYKNHNLDESTIESEETDQIDVKHAIIAGVLLSLLTLPPPKLLISCFVTKFVFEKDLDISHITKKDIEKEGGEDEFENIDGTVTDNRLCSDNKKRSPSKKVTPESNLNEPVTYFDRCIGCKVVCLVFSFILCLIAIIVFGVSSGNITNSLTNAMLISWFIAVFGGWFVLNLFRIMLIALFAPIVAQNEIQNQEAGKGRKVTGSAIILGYLFVPNEAKEMIKDQIMVSLEINKVNQQQIYNRPSKQQQQSMSSPNSSQIQSKNARNSRYVDNSVDIEIEKSSSREQKKV